MSLISPVLLIGLIVAGVAQAQVPRDGCTNASGTSGVFARSGTVCDQQTACATNFHQCLGTGSLNCSLAALCIGAQVTCLSAAASNTTGCPALADLHSSLLLVSAGTQLYNESDAYKSCVASSCGWLNSTFSGAGSSCTLDYSTMCVSPVSAVATILFRGSFSTILADAAKRLQFADAIAKDMTTAFKFLCRVRRMVIAGVRRQAQQTLIVEIEIPGVSSKNAAFTSAFNTIAANPGAFLTQASAAYSSLTGETLVVLKIGTGGSSTAFSSIPIPTTAQPTGSPSNNTATPRPPTPASNDTRAPTVAPGTGGSSSSMAIVSTALCLALTVVALLL